MDNMRRFMKTQTPQMANVNLASLIDSRLVKELDETGFIDLALTSYGLSK